MTSLNQSRKVGSLCRLPRLLVLAFSCILQNFTRHTHIPGVIRFKTKD